MKNNNEWKKLFRDRLLQFAVMVISLSGKLPKNAAGYAISSQLIRSGTSIGANIEEAQDASSHKDFIQKVSISLREARETLYWIKIIKESNLIESKSVQKELVECDELVSILTTIVKSSKVKSL